MTTFTPKLTVHLTTTHKQKVGTLAYKDRKIYFKYDAEFLKTGIELSPYKLPLKSGVMRCKNDPIHRHGIEAGDFFYDVAPPFFKHSFATISHLTVRILR